MESKVGAGKRWLSDAEVDVATGGAIKRRRLQKDRIGAQEIPFHRIGRTCLYDLDEVNAAIERARVGGAQRGRRAA